MSLVEVSSEITGTVWKVLVSVGEEVSLDQDLMILESMKMEIPIVAPAPGQVAGIHVEEGRSIREGQVVLLIET